MKTAEFNFNDYIWEQSKIIQQLYLAAYDAGKNRERELDEMTEAHKQMEQDALYEGRREQEELDYSDYDPK